jgi:hypothetical protein
MNLWSVDRHAVEGLELVTGQNDRSIRESFSLGNEVDLRCQHRPSLSPKIPTHDVHSESISSLVEPPVHHVKDGLSELGVLPVEI